MGIVKTDVPMTAALCSRTIDALAEAYPCCRQEILTKTAFGRPMKALVIGSGEARQLTDRKNARPLPTMATSGLPPRCC